MTSFLLEFILFILFVVAGLYIPGKFFLTKLRVKLVFLEDIFLSLSIGILIFTLISYILSWIKLADLLLPVILGINILVIVTLKNNILPKLDKNHLKPLLLVFAMSIFFSLSMLVTGIFDGNIIFRNDDPWHLALINELKIHFPPDNPGFSQIPLKGYHFFYNFILAKISNLFFISPFSLHFHFFPSLVSILWGLGVYTLMFKWSKKVSASLWAVFLTMFGGSFAFILYLQGHLGFSFDSGFGISQPFGSLYNPPFSISIVFLITALIILYEYIATKDKNWLIPLTLCIGLISMFKVYAGMILVGAFLVFTLIEIFKKRYIIIFSLLGVAILFFGTYWVFAGGFGYLIFYPLWPPHRILQTYPWYGYDEKIYTFTKFNVIRGLIQTELDGLNVFILGNLGTRLIGLLFLVFIFIKNRILPSYFALMVFLMAVISITIPMFFIQSGKVFEMIQMTQYFLFFSALFAAFGFSYFFSLRFNKFIKIIVFALILMLTLPSAAENLKNYAYTAKTGQSLSAPYFQTLSFLAKQKDYDATVLEMPGLGTKTDNKSLLEWYRSSTPQITAFSNKRSFLSNQYIDFPGLDKEKRLNFIKNMIIFTTTPATSSAYLDRKEKIIKGLYDNKIHFIFSSYEVLSFMDTPNIKKIYKNSPYVIYKVY